MKDKNTRLRYLKIQFFLSALLATATLLFVVLPGCQKTAPPDATSLTEAAEFDVSGLTIIPSEVAEGESVEVTAMISNLGEADGSLYVSLEINDEEVEGIDVELSAGQSEEITFSYTAKDAGLNSVELYGLSGTFNVIRPAKFEWASLTLTPSEIEAGNTVAITTDVCNKGDVNGTCTAVLSVNDETVEEEIIDIKAGETKQVSFSFTADNPGTYDITVNGVTGILEVLESKPPEPIEVSIVRNNLIIDFPDQITFSLDCESEEEMTKVVLEYGTDSRSIVSEVSRVEPEYAVGKQVKTSWVWDMRKTGSLPSGASIWWRWRITHEDDSVFTTPRKTVIYLDDRYDWQMLETKEMNFYWHGIGTDLINEFSEDVATKLSRIELGITIPEERKPEIFIYPSADELRSAVLFSQEWTGALAFPSYNIVLIPVTYSNLDWAKRTLAHEVTHLIVGDFLFGPFGEIPTWLNEGLAQYAEGEMDEYLLDILNQAINNDELISVKSLNSSFPTSPQKAYLAYAQSASLVNYLIDDYGWDKMKDLLEEFKEGSTCDKALQTVYSFDTDRLEERWRNQFY